MLNVSTVFYTPYGHRLYWNANICWYTILAIYMGIVLHFGSVRDGYVFNRASSII